MSFEVRTYQVLITPLVARDTYGTTTDVTKDVDITDFVKRNGVGSIKSGVDNNDYEIGTFLFSDLKLKVLNPFGKFNDQNDPRSMFQYTRDLAKIDIKLFSQDTTSTTNFSGIINEEATRQNFLKGEVEFKVLSLGSILRKTKVSGGVVSTGVTFSSAIKTILNQTDITRVVNYDVSKISVDYDGTIDNGSYFDNKVAKDALDDLLLASNSVLFIDETGTFVVKNRTDNDGDILRLYGPHDLDGRQNIVDIKSYNTGFHRIFNSIKINNTLIEDNDLITEMGMRRKTIDLEFVTDVNTETDIANRILSEFKAPKVEMSVVVATETARTAKLYDLVSIKSPLRATPYTGSYLPVFDLAVFDTDVFPYESGAIDLHETTAFKIIGFKENPAKFTTEIKLRQRGLGFDDGYYSDTEGVFDVGRFDSAVFK